jgi:hypothetical protein
VALEVAHGDARVMAAAAAAEDLFEVYPGGDARVGPVEHEHSLVAVGEGPHPCLAGTRGDRHALSRDGPWVLGSQRPIGVNQVSRVHNGQKER